MAVTASSRDEWRRPPACDVTVPALLEFLEVVLDARALWKSETLAISADSGRNVWLHARPRLVRAGVYRGYSAPAFTAGQETSLEQLGWINRRREWLLDTPSAAIGRDVVNALVAVALSREGERVTLRRFSLERHAIARWAMLGAQAA